MPLDKLVDRQNHNPGCSTGGMDLSDTSDELLADTYVHLVQLQDDLVALESEAEVDEETDPVVGEVSELITRVQDELHARDLDEQELRDQART